MLPWWWSAGLRARVSGSRGDLGWTLVNSPPVLFTFKMLSMVNLSDATLRGSSLFIFAGVSGCRCTNPRNILVTGSITPGVRSRPAASRLHRLTPPSPRRFLLLTPETPPASNSYWSPEAPMAEEGGSSSWRWFGVTSPDTRCSGAGPRCGSITRRIDLHYFISLFINVFIIIPLTDWTQPIHLLHDTCERPRGCQWRGQCVDSNLRPSDHWPSILTTNDHSVCFNMFFFYYYCIFILFQSMKLYCETEILLLHSKQYFSPNVFNLVSIFIIFVFIMFL